MCRTELVEVNSFLQDKIIPLLTKVPEG
jgi:hypothetical protein